MSDQADSALVLRDSDGNFHLLDRETLERTRITDDSLREQIQRSLLEEKEVSGYTLFPTSLIFKLPTIATMGGYGTPHHGLPSPIGGGDSGPGGGGVPPPDPDSPLELD